jgi:hypothetical protein
MTRPTNLLGPLTLARFPASLMPLRVGWKARSMKAGGTRTAPVGLAATVALTLVVGGAGEATAGVNRWTSHGPEGGGVAALAIDPATPTTLYAGTSGGGIFKSGNGGGSWSPANAGLTNPSVPSLAIDPATPTVLYAGTTGGGVFKSVDGGASWSAVNTALTNRVVFALTVDPATPTTVYAGTSGGGVFQIRQLPIATSLVLALSLNASAFHSGEVLSANLFAANPGPAGVVDLFFGLLLPPEVGPALGCPGGDPVVFLADSFTRIVLTCLSSSPAGFSPLVHEVAVPAGLPPTAFPVFFSHALPPVLPLGSYAVFAAATPPEAFLDGTLDPGDVLAVTAAPFAIVPSLSILRSRPMRE